MTDRTIRTTITMPVQLYQKLLDELRKNKKSKPSSTMNQIMITAIHAYLITGEINELSKTNS